MNMELRHCTISLQTGHTEISKFLVINEANINIMDKEGLTPLDWAHWMNQTEMANLIRKYSGKRTKVLIKIIYNKLAFSFIL